MDGGYLFCGLVLGRPEVGVGFMGTHRNTVNKILLYGRPKESSIRLDVVVGL